MESSYRYGIVHVSKMTLLMYRKGGTGIENRWYNEYNIEKRGGRFPWKGTLFVERDTSRGKGQFPWKGERPRGKSNVPKKGYYGKV